MNEQHSNSSSPLHFRCLPSYSIQDILYPSPSVSDPSFDADCQHYPPPLVSSVHGTPRDEDHPATGGSSSSTRLGTVLSAIRFGLCYRHNSAT